MDPSDKDKAKPAVSEPPASPPAADVVLVHGVTGDGQGLAVIRKREDRLEFGAVHPLQEGKPIHGEVVRLKPRQECPLVCDVEVAVPAPSTSTSDSGTPKELAAQSRKGPAQVASASYRENWDVIWSRPPKKPELAN